MKYISTVLCFVCAQFPNISYCKDIALSESNIYKNQTQQVSPKVAINNTKNLTAGAEIFENLTESASSIDTTGFKKSLSEFETLYPQIIISLSPDQKNQLDDLALTIHKSWAAGDRSEMASQAIEIYRLLNQSIDYKGQSIPIEVSMLDYVGFKINALLLSKKPDWKQMLSITQEASGWWATIEPKIEDTMLREAMTHTILGMKQSAKEKNTEFLKFSANMDLILVDGLETYFSAHNIKSKRHK